MSNTLGKYLNTNAFISLSANTNTKKNIYILSNTNVFDPIFELYISNITYIYFLSSL